MNKTSKNRILGIAAAVALAAGIYTTTNSLAHGLAGHTNQTSQHGQMMGGARGWSGPQGMMIGYPGGNGHHMGPAIMGPGWMGGHMMGNSPMGFGGMFTDVTNIENQLNTLNNQLGITKDQTAAWNDYVKTVTEQAQLHSKLFNTMHGTNRPTTLANQEQHLTAMEQMIGANKTAFQAYQTLYNKLDSRQQSIANRLTFPCHG